MPILSQINYQYYQFIPLPIHGKILIPPNTHLLQSENGKEIWTSEECQMFEEQAICIHTKSYTRKSNDTCFTNIIQKKPYQCQLHNLQLDSNWIDIIQDQIIVIIPTKTMSIVEDCPSQIKNEIFSTEPTELFPGECSYLIEDNWIKLGTTQLTIRPLHFPELELSNTSTISLQMKNLDSLTHDLHHLQSIQLQDFKTSHYTSNYWYLLLLIPIGLIIWCLWKKPMIPKLAIMMSSSNRKQPSEPTPVNPDPASLTNPF